MVEKGINVLSLFGGMECGCEALKRAGIKINKYYSSEIDKHAIQIANKNHPEIIQLGDVNNWQNWDIDWASIDLLLAGFPCQAWSMAGKQEGDRDPRGQLMWIMLDILNHIRAKNPNVKFLFENVVMKSEFLSYVNKAIGVEPMFINSALVSAQNRERCYWFNFGPANFNIFGIRQCYIPRPNDKNIYIEDILDNSVEHKWRNVEDLDPTFTKNYVQFDVSGKGYKSQQDRAYYIDSKFGTLANARAESKVKIVAMRGRNIVNGKRLGLKGAKTIQRLEPRFDGESNALTTVSKDNLILDGLWVRDLTPIECERLQTLPDGYTGG